MDRESVLKLEVGGPSTLLGGEPPAVVMSRYPANLSAVATWAQEVSVEEEEEEEMEVVPVEEALVGALEGGASKLLLVGEEGWGKTTALERVASGWARGDHLATFSHLLPLRLRDVDLRRHAPPQTLEALMLRCGATPAALAAVTEAPQRLLLLIDDLHRLEASSEPICSDPGEEAPPSQLLLSLVGGSLLRGASLLMCSRPSVAAAVCGGGGMRRLQLLGFLRTQREAFVRSFFAEKEERAAAAMAHMDQTLTFYRFSAAPRFCWSVCGVYRQLMEDGQPLPQTLSQLCAQMLLRLLRPLRAEAARELLLALGGLAARTAFGQEELDAALPSALPSALPPHGALTGFLRRDGEESSASCSFSFRSALVRDFLLAASFLLSAETGEGSQALLDKHGDHAPFLDAFLFALCQPEQRRPLEAALGAFRPERLEECERTLRALSAAALHGFGKDRHQRCFRRLLEAQSAALVGELVTPDSRVGISYGGLSQRDAAALNFVLCSLPRLQLLNLYRSRGLREHTLRRLVPAIAAAHSIILSDSSFSPGAVRCLASALSRSNATQLELSNSRELGDQGFTLLCAGLRGCKVQTLRLRLCGLTEASCEEAASVLSSPGAQLRVVELSANQIADGGLLRICQGLQSPHCSLQELLLQHCGLTAASMEALAAALCSGQSQLQTLDLSQNQIGDRGAELLFVSLRQPLCPLRSLRMTDNELTEACCGALRDALISPHLALQELDLSVNELGQPGALLLCDGLGQSARPLARLGLQRCGLTPPVFRELGALLRGGASKMAALSVGLSPVGDQGVRPLWEALAHPDCQLEELDLEMCGLTDGCVEELCGALRSSVSLRRLQLSNNQLSDASVPALLRAATDAARLQELDLKYNEFSEEVFDALDECGKVKY